jgi:hypothetical protein
MSDDEDYEEEGDYEDARVVGLGHAARIAEHMGHER